MPDINDPSLNLRLEQIEVLNEMLLLSQKQNQILLSRDFGSTEKDRRELIQDMLGLFGSVLPDEDGRFESTLF